MMRDITLKIQLYQISSKWYNWKQKWYKWIRRWKSTRILVVIC